MSCILLNTHHIPPPPVLHGAQHSSYFSNHYHKILSLLPIPVLLHVAQYSSYPFLTLCSIYILSFLHAVQCLFYPCLKCYSILILSLLHAAQYSYYPYPIQLTQLIVTSCLYCCFSIFLFFCWVFSVYFEVTHCQQNWLLILPPC